MNGPHYYFAGPAPGLPAPVPVLGRGNNANLGTPEPLQVLTTLDDVRTATRRAVSGARRLLSIYTLDLEPQLYEQASFLELIKGFLLSHSFAKVRLLTHRPVHYTSPNKLAAIDRKSVV